MAWGRSGEVVAGGRSASWIDEAVLARLLADLGADDVLDVCRVYLADARERLVALRASCQSGDAVAAAQSAHLLKSASGFLGVQGVAGLCREIENLAREGRLDEAKARVELISEALEQVFTDLVALVRRLSALDSDEVNRGRRGP